MIAMRASALALFGLVLCAADKQRVYPSPDGQRRAVVTTTSSGESVTRIERPSGRVLLTRDERSKDGAHGRGVVHAEWTPDSRFFVVSTEAVGGHQPWARPLWVYKRRSERIVDLASIGVVPTSDFKLRPVNKVVFQHAGGDAAPSEVAVDLRTFVVRLSGRTRPSVE